MVGANPKSYQERPREAGAEARDKRFAEKAARQSQMELVVEVKRGRRGRESPQPSRAKPGIRDGAPWTLATYMIAGQGTLDWPGDYDGSGLSEFD